MARRLTTLLAAGVAVMCATGLTAAPSDSDLEVVRLDPTTAPPGGSTVVHAFVANGGPDQTASPVTVVVRLPSGFTAEGPYFPEDCRPEARGRLVRCTFGAGLARFRTATALVPVRVDADVPFGTEAEGHVQVISVDDRDPRNNRTPFTLSVDS
ncbi:hypothetical protein OG895_46485 [Streptomyces sp. NBC_00201]|uniref:hypothetical protein n=1 Tax=unclassified Streptomyces TaxID=2593676 RepID=UPI00225C21FD|nr:MULTISPECIES: hypothetical protein [unclassified Streptomyces]MCX5059737.1 hypothetical protein [Streptomyces sp. NBC_00452]MCX5252481.1 hypothetical protein [Streptomyces sp. NBC_00201]MCX5290649.1 hypothetical protein [Streptomyces sp. NBC_00183]